MVECEECGGPLVHMGTLGWLVWFRCRCCGLDQSVAVADLDEEE